MSNTDQLKEDYNWAGRFVATIFVAWVLAAIISNMDLFEKTYVIYGKLSAAHLVRFLGYTTSLVALWMLGQRATVALQQHGGRWSFMQQLILPVVSLIVVASSNSVALLVLKPVMNAGMHNIYNWVFIVAILACAAWVVMAVLGQSSSLTNAFTSAVERMCISGQIKTCSACNAGSTASSKFCRNCGKELPEAAD